jgi:hypothetical protein
MKNNYLLIALAGFLGYVIYNKMRKGVPITTTVLPTQPLMPIITSGANTQPTNNNDGSPGSGRRGIL